tara:strand:+ start:2310 stop:2672 length:363 start_codon:yes stop_codon:yes gene_type:complete
MEDESVFTGLLQWSAKNYLTEKSEGFKITNFVEDDSVRLLFAALEKACRRKANNGTGGRATILLLSFDNLPLTEVVSFFQKSKKTSAREFCSSGVSKRLILLVLTSMVLTALSKAYPLPL